MKKFVDPLLIMVIILLIAHCFALYDLNKQIADTLYLRRVVVLHNLYVPCTNAGFDEAMGVDCKSFNKAKIKQ